MQEAVTGVLIDRARQAQGIGRMVLLSLLAHVVLITAVILAPRNWSATQDDAAKPLMITLGGAPGPRQGRNPISAKPVQEVAPIPTKPKVEAPPAPPKPVMVEPTRTAKPEARNTAKPELRKEAPQLHGRAPTTGAQVKAGTAKVETAGVPTPFGGLATGGGGAGALLDVKNFCCPDYLITMTDVIRRNWQQNQGQTGVVVVKFTIMKDGTLTDIQVEKPNAYFLNMAAQRAVVQTRQLPPLPAAFTEDHLTVHLSFEYQR